jgi:hypothetical protein
MAGILFQKWLNHFVLDVSNKGVFSSIKRHILILDGHNS